jgi:hypothetical protein
MSSPKRAAKTLSKTASKTVSKSVVKTLAKTTAVRRTPTARPAKPSVAVMNGATAEAKRVAATLEHIVVDGNLDAISAEALQALIAAACRLYRARREAGEEFAPVPKNSISATDVMVTASGLLKATDLAVFELGMWQNWTGR